MHLKDLDAIAHHVGRIGTEHHELIGMHHEADVAGDRASARARQCVRQGLQRFAPDVLVGKRKNGGQNAVQEDTLALAIAQCRVKRPDVVAENFIEQLALPLRRQFKQPFARDCPVAHFC
jgi:hypothetical protein